VVFDRISGCCERLGATAPVRLHTLLADGADQVAATLALKRGWDLTSPLPFGRVLNRAIVAGPRTLADARALLAGQSPVDRDVAAPAAEIFELERQARLFELADQDGRLSDLLLETLAHPEDFAGLSRFRFEIGQRFALASRLIVEQSDLVLAIWDGSSTAHVGGTGYTVCVALAQGVPVLRIDPAKPDELVLLHSAEALAASAGGGLVSDTELTDIVLHAVGMSTSDDAAIDPVNKEKWRAHSAMAHHAYRRTEALFGNTGLRDRFASVRQRYEPSAEIALGGGAPLLSAITALPGGDPKLADRLSESILARFAWADGVSTFLSDRYRSGMILNFLLGSLAIVGGILYLPLGFVERKWLFAAFELAVLLLVIVNTLWAQRDNVHGRWFETRRAAEYLRHSPLMLAAGVARPSGRWPIDKKSGWPELYARLAIREVGLPAASVGTDYLRHVLRALLDTHVLPQRDYHTEKARRLNRVHHALDRGSVWLFVAAVVSVGTYLGLAGLDEAGFMRSETLQSAAKWFTVLGVALPTAGGALAGIRYFADFERFAGISEVTAQRLGNIGERIELLQRAPDSGLDFGRVSQLVHAVDEIVFQEILSWQAVFSGKRISVSA
jgi:hypothetical protein